MARTPLAGLIGGGIDMARRYVVKSRLQHTCDARALSQPSSGRYFKSAPY
ncbi:Tad domain-containing protein [Sphingomonas asaccharolytica]|nr:Tad domain-containing protein [Sphingomonas asaccharolytica]